MAENEGVEVDHWAGLRQPENMYWHPIRESYPPEPRERQLRSLRARLGWVTDELSRRKKGKSPTKRQKANLLRLRKLYRKHFEGGTARSRN